MQRETIDAEIVERARKQAQSEHRRVVIRDKLKAFALRASASGVVSFTLQYTDRDGVQRLYTLPAAECSTPNQARAFAEDLRQQMRTDKSFDPLRNRRIGREAQEVEQKAGHTISQLCDEWLIRRTDKRSLASDRVLINAYIKPRLGEFRIDEVTRKDIADAMRAIGATTPIMANRFHALVSSLLNFAGNGISGVDGLHWLDETRLNPASGIKRFRETSRERNLSPDEMRRFLDTLDRHQDTAPGRQVKLLMLTLSRRAEVLGAKWSEFALDSDPGFWIKPASRTKLGRTVRVPVVGGALDLLRTMRAQARNGDDRLFPGRQQGEVKALQRFWIRLTREAALADFHVHDLRHCGATVLASSGVPLFVIAKLLGHANSSRVTERYSHLTDHAAADAMSALSANYRATSPQNPQIEAKSESSAG
jgi:integrase